MRAFLAAARTWSPSVRAGVFFGVGMSICLVFVPGWPEGWVGRVVIGVIVGAFCGSLFGFTVGRFIESEAGTGCGRAVLDELSVQQKEAARRAAVRGPAPADPVLRRAALRMAESSRDSINRRGRSLAAIYGVALAAYLVVALTASGWWWLVFAAFAGVFAVHLISRRRVDRRIAVLSGSSDGLSTFDDL